MEQLRSPKPGTSGRQLSRDADSTSLSGRLSAEEGEISDIGSMSDDIDESGDSPFVRSGSGDQLKIKTPHLMKVMERYGLQQYASIGRGSCGYISVAIRLGWEPIQVADLVYRMLYENTDAFVRWMCGNNTDKRQFTQVKKEVKCFFNGLQRHRGSIATRANPLAQLNTCA